MTPFPLKPLHQHAITAYKVSSHHASLAAEAQSRLVFVDVVCS